MNTPALPHHDGSPLFCSDEAPALGSTVTVRVRTDPDAEPTAIWLRTVEDAEPFYAVCVHDSPGWWSAPMRVTNPVQRYRFMVGTGGGPDGEDYVWLTQSGVWHHDVPDAEDFVISTHAPAPDWGRDAVVYQVFPDRFARSAAADDRPIPAWAVPAAWDDDPIHVGPDTPLQYYGGDLDGVTEHLDHVARVGADTVYLTPVFPGESNHRYNASTFDEVDPLLGGDAAYARLVGAVHERGWRMLGDLTSNHTGDTHEWFRRAIADPQAPERAYYFIEDDGTYEGWKGHGTLPKLDHTCDEMRARLVEGPDSVVGRWLSPPFEVDGWRIDVANMTGRRGAVDVAHDVARRIRTSAQQIRPDALVLAEHGHDASGDLDGDGWHGTMNYYGFSFPVWTWLRDPERRVPSFGLPVGIPLRTGPEMVAAMRSFTARFGWRAVASSWNILGSHDSPRIRTTTGSAERHHVAVGLQFTLPGVPMVFAGDELGQEGTDGEDSRRTMPWATESSWDTTTLEVYADLAALRRSSLALRRGSLRWLHVSDDLIVYVREHASGSVLCAASRAATASADVGVSGELLYASPGGDSGGSGVGGSGGSGVGGSGAGVLDGAVPASDGPAFRAWAVSTD